MQWLVAALAAIGVYALPLFTVWFTGTQYISFANESLAYRYFTSVRILHGEGASAWLPQGQLLTLLQNGIVLWLTNVAGMSPADIAHTLQPFGLATEAVLTVLGAALIAWVMLDHRFTAHDKILVTLAALAPLAVTQANGFYYSALPDYYSVTMVLALAYVVLFVRLERHGAQLTWQHAVWIGIFCGMSLANKITLVALAGIIAAQVVVNISCSSRYRLSLCMALFIAAAALGFLAIFVFAYLGRIRDAVAVLHNWYDFGINAGREAGFERFQQGLFIAYHYHLVFLGFCCTLLIAITVAALDKNVRHSRATLLGAVGLTTAFVAYAIYRRPAGTTLFDAAIILISQTAMILAMLQPVLVVRHYTKLLAFTTLVFALFTFQYNLNRVGIVRPQQIARTAWQIHGATQKIHGPWVLLIPDNNYGWGGVEELIVKGTSDFSWHDVAGAKWIRDRVAPGMIFRRWPDLDSRNRVFLWIMRIGDSGYLVENSIADPDHRTSWLALETAARDPESRCQTWLPVSDHRVRLCFLASPLGK